MTAWGLLEEKTRARHEVEPRATRRRFPAAYKARIMEEADRYSERGAVEPRTSAASSAAG